MLLPHLTLSGICVCYKFSTKALFTHSCCNQSCIHQLYNINNRDTVTHTTLLLCYNGYREQSQSYITTDSQSVSMSSMSWCQAQSGTFDQRFFFLKVTVLSFGDYRELRVRVWVTLQLTVSLGVEPNLRLLTRDLFFFSFESFCLVIWGRPLWREVGSVICQSTARLQ
jgi:hypothetical protein